MRRASLRLDRFCRLVVRAESLVFRLLVPIRLRLGDLVPSKQRDLAGRLVAVVENVEGIAILLNQLPYLLPFRRVFRVAFPAMARRKFKVRAIGVTIRVTWLWLRWLIWSMLWLWLHGRRRRRGLRGRLNRVILMFRLLRSDGGLWLWLGVKFRSSRRLWWGWRTRRCHRRQNGR